MAVIIAAGNKAHSANHPPEAVPFLRVTSAMAAALIQPNNRLPDPSNSDAERLPPAAHDEFSEAAHH
jgi:hypothetical protein